MTQYETELAAAPAPASRARWPLANVFWIDLLIAVVLAVGAATTVAGVFLAANALRLSIPLTALGNRSQAELLALVGPIGMALSVLAQNCVLVLVPVVRVALLRHEPLARIGFQAPRPLRLIGLGLGLGVLVLVMNAAFGLTFNAFGIRQNQVEQFPLPQGDVVGQAFFFLAAAVIAPIGEEIFFRGYAFNAFLQSWGRTRLGTAVAYVVSALLFSVAHSLSATQGLIGLLVPVFVMGLLLAWAMHRTHSLIPCIIAHGLNNGVALLAVLACVNNPSLACPNV